MSDTTHDNSQLDRIGVNERDGADMLGVSPRTFRKFITRGDVKPIRIPGVRRNIFDVRELRALVESWKTTKP